MNDPTLDIGRTIDEAEPVDPDCYYTFVQPAMMRLCDEALHHDPAIIMAITATLRRRRQQGHEPRLVG